MSASLTQPASASAASLWRREPPLARDRRTVLTAEQIAITAFELAEQPGGLTATSVKRVAHRLGLPTARLEEYLPDRSDLLDLMLDTALAEITPSLAEESADWRNQLEAQAQALRAMALRHPWVVELIGGRPPSGPNGLVFMEESLASLTSAGLPVAEAAQAANAVHALVCGSVQMHVARAGRTTAATADYLRQAVDEADLTNLASLFEEPSGVGADQAFEYGLTCLLDGMSLRLAEYTGV